MDEACGGASWERIMRNMCQSASVGENGPFRPHRSQPAKTPARAPRPPTAHPRAPHALPRPTAARPTTRRRAPCGLPRSIAARLATSCGPQRRTPQLPRTSQPAAARPAAPRGLRSPPPRVLRLSRSAPVRPANPLAHRLAFCEPATRTNVSRETSRKQSETTDQPPRDHRRHALERQ